MPIFRLIYRSSIVSKVSSSSMEFLQEKAVSSSYEDHGGIVFWFKSLDSRLLNSLSWKLSNGKPVGLWPNYSFGSKSLADLFVLHIPRMTFVINYEIFWLNSKHTFCWILDFVVDRFSCCLLLKSVFKENRCLIGNYRHYNVGGLIQMNNYTISDWRFRLNTPKMALCNLNLSFSFNLFVDLNVMNVVKNRLVGSVGMWPSRWIRPRDFQEVSLVALIAKKVNFLICFLLQVNSTMTFTSIATGTACSRRPSWTRAFPTWSQKTKPI